MPEQPLLPDGWEEPTLGDVSEVISGIGFPKKYQGHTTGKYPFYKVGDISEAVRNGKINLSSANNYVSQDVCETLRGKPLQKETIVFAKIGEALKLNRRAIITQDSLVDNNVMGVVSKSKKLSNKYLFYFFLTVDLGDLSRATTVPSVRKSDVQDIQIPLPPLPEQEKIVAKIEELFTQLDAGIAELKAAQKQLKRYRQSVLKSAVEGELTREWRESQGGLEPAPQLLQRILAERREKWEEESGKKKYQEPAVPDVEGLPTLPDGWVWVNTKLACQFFQGVQVPVKKQYIEQADGMVRFLRIIDFTQGYQEPRYITRPGEKYEVKPGDVSMVRYGASTGFVCSGKSGVIANNLFQVIPYGESINKRFLYYCLNSPYFQEHIKRRIKGAAMPAVSFSVLHELSLPLCSTEEQQRIVEMVERRLSVADEIEKELDEALVRAERLRQSVLKSAFEGRLV